ncbi:MAG: carboxypeptidase regulatory-like domain-containing protein [Saprospiraceae bacterium]|nr:carboxypeptidase regulatory-like domain-containing protein [Saprospiraceae bacterium]
MFQHPIFRLFLLLTILPYGLIAQNSAPLESELLSFKATGTAENNRAVLHVQIFEAGVGGPILGATVLLRRDIDKMHGKVTNEYGSCTFIVAPGDYALRVQMTGLKSLEQAGLVMEAGKIYEMKLLMASNTK